MCAVAVAEENLFVGAVELLEDGGQALEVEVLCGRGEGRGVDCVIVEDAERDGVGGLDLVSAVVGACC